jgi:hypothetical protein
MCVAHQHVSYMQNLVCLVTATLNLSYNNYVTELGPRIRGSGVLTQISIEELAANFYSDSCLVHSLLCLANLQFRIQSKR